MQHSQTLPWYVGAAARLHVISDGEPRFLVLVAAAAEDAVPEALTRPGGVSAILTHAPGRSWPDRQGEALAQAIVVAGGVAALGFTSLADALACHSRIKGPQL